MGKEVTFIGPTSPVMRVLGDKIGSNLVAQKAGVSTMPWNGDGMTADLDELGNIPFEQARLPLCAVCGVRRAACGVRRAACGVRRAALGFGFGAKPPDTSRYIERHTERKAHTRVYVYT